MTTKYTREQLLNFSNEQIMEKTNGRSVDFHLKDGHWTQLCVNDLQGFDGASGYFNTRTDIKIRLQDVDFIEVK